VAPNGTFSDGSSSPISKSLNGLQLHPKEVGALRSGTGNGSPRSLARGRNISTQSPSAISKSGKQSKSQPRNGSVQRNDVQSTQLRHHSHCGTPLPTEGGTTIIIALFTWLF
jgi:hypothetical protein